MVTYEQFEMIFRRSDHFLMINIVLYYNNIIPWPFLSLSNYRFLSTTRTFFCSCCVPIYSCYSFCTTNSWKITYKLCEKVFVKCCHIRNIIRKITHRRKENQRNIWTKSSQNYYQVIIFIQSVVRLSFYTLDFIVNFYLYIDFINSLWNCQS